VTASPSAGEQRKFLANTIKPGGVAGVPESYYRKALDLNRFSNGVANKLLESYRRQIVKAVRELERIDKMPSSKKPQFKAARMRALIKQNLDAMKKWSGQSINELIQQLDGLADVEVAFARAELQRVVPAAVKTQVRTVEVTESFAKAVVKADPLDVGTNLLQDSFEEAVKGPGSVMKLTARQGAVIRMPDGTSIVKAFRGLAERQGELFSRAVLDGLLTGESTASIARSLYGELGFSTEALTPRQVALAQQGNAWKMAKHQVRTLVRTSVNATSNAASLQVYKANPNLTKKYRWIATLDSNTTAICRNLDQKEFFYGKGPTPANPPHFGCRSTTVPVIDYAGASKKFGIDIPPPSSKIGYRPTKEGTPSSADPKGGRVPVGTSAAQHLYDLRGTTKAGKKSRFNASPAQARMLNGGKATPGAFEKARYYNRLADRYGPDGAMKRFMREDGSEVSLKQLRSRYGEPDKITKSKKAATPKAKPTTKILTKNEKIAKQVMQDPALRSDKKRIEAMVDKGVPKGTDFVGLIADAKQKSGLSTTEKFAKVKPKLKPKTKAVAKPKSKPIPKVETPTVDFDAELASVTKELKFLTPELLKAKVDPGALKKTKELIAKKNKLLADKASKQAKSGKVSDVSFEHQSRLFKEYGFKTEAAFDEAKQGIQDWTNMAYTGLRNEQLSRVPTKNLTAYEVSKVERWNKKKKQGDVFYDYETLEKNLDTFVKNAPKYQGEVLRGNAVNSVADAESMIKSVANGRRTPTYDSWTTNSDQAQNFFEDGEVGILWKMKNKNGVPIAAHSRFQKEAEVLMPKGNLYNVQNVKKTLVDGQTVFEVTLDQVSP